MTDTSDDDYDSAESDFGLPVDIIDKISSDESCNIPPSDGFIEFSHTPAMPYDNLQGVGVTEGNESKYDSNDFAFAYCEKLIELFGGGHKLVFEDFIKPTEDRFPASGRSFIDGQLVDNLKKSGIVEMRPIQAAAFSATFCNNEVKDDDDDVQPSDFLGISSTGSGKSHAFLIPVFQQCLNNMDSKAEKRTPFALIFAHSTALVEGIYKKAVELAEGTNIIVKIIAGKHDFIRDTNFDIAVCAVGRFLNHFGSGNTNYVKIDLNALQYVVVDEADKMAEHEEFYQLYMKMKEKAKFVTMLFSATVDMSVMDYVDQNNFYQFRYGKTNAVALSIKQRFWEVNSKNVTKIVGFATGNVIAPIYEQGEICHPFDMLYLHISNIIRKGLKKRYVVFVKRICVADFIAQKLCIYGIDAVSVHGGDKSRDAVEKRTRLLDKFIHGDVHVLVATQLLTRGTDIEVDYVINYDLPQTYFDYIHRCGRTGRNQQTGTAITFVDLKNPDDYSPQVLKQIVMNYNGRLPAFLVDFAETSQRNHELAMKERKERENIAMIG